VSEQLTLDGAKPAYTRARNTDPHTSHEAAASVLRIRETQQRILTSLRTHGPLTDEQISHVAFEEGWYTSPSGLRTRRSELVEAGLVVDSTLRHRTVSGRRSIIWKAR
jgi:hypothetical protein